MEPVYDVTREESEKNFKNHSFLTKTEVMYAVDAWLDKVKRNQYEIQISDTGKTALKNALSKLRESLLMKDMPALEFYGRRYTLDIFDDCVQCGYEIFGNHELFDKNGYTVPWALTEEEAKEYEEKDGEDEEAGDKSKFYIVSRIPIQLMPIEKWAKENGVKPATARQWAARERIHARKVGRNLMVSPIQYTAAAFAASKDTTSRFTGRVKTESIKGAYSFLFDEVVDIAIMPSAEKNVFMVGRNGNESLTATTVAMDMEDRLAFTEALLGIGMKEHGYLRSPIGSADFDPSYRFARVICPRWKEAEGIIPEDLDVDVSVSGKASMKTSSNPDDWMVGGRSPEVSIHVTGGLDVAFTGYLMDRYDTAEVRLLKSIFGEHPVDAVVSSVLEKAGVKEARRYPWDETVLFVTGIKTEKEVTKEQLSFLLRSLPRMVKEGTTAKPTSMVLRFSTVKGPTAVNMPADAFLAEDAAKLSGFATVRKGKGFTDFHAYVGTGRVLRPRKQESAE